MCRNYHQCQRCIDMDHVDCPAWAPYKYRGNIDPVTGLKRLQCKNKNGSCRRHHCECDKKLAMDLSKITTDWQPQFSIIGGFNRTAECTRSITKAPRNPIQKEMECCGKNPSRFP